MTNLQEIHQTITAGPFAANWDSLRGYTIPSWYEDGKFGIFIHWGLYAVPAFGNEWYPRHMYLPGRPEFDHHVATYGPHSQFGYKDFIPHFTAARYEPAEWAALFKEAGARYVVPVAEHHDGFPLYDSALTEWCAAKMGPQRDLIGELAAAVRNEGLVFGLSSHRAEHWWFMNGGRDYDSDVNDPRYQDFYGPATPMEGDPHKLDARPYPDAAFLDNWLLRTCELVDKYQPQLIWFDWWIGHEAFKPYLPRFAAYYYNRGAQWGKGVAINHKFEAFPEGTTVFDIERGQLAGIRPLLWQNDTSVSKNSWGYVHNQQYKTVDSLVDDLVDVVSKNGALLLNIGPKPDGTIPEPEQQMLREIGAWLQVNGAAIYGTRPWKIFGEGPTEVSEGSFTDTKRSDFTGEDIRFTTKGDALYAIALAWPGRQMAVRSLGQAAGFWNGPVGAVRLLGHDGPLSWTQTDQALVVDLPEQPPCAHAFVVEVRGG
ncbi:MAG: alpha-L-fucosidase [Caldilineaceae bacterium]|nr:alpha-L-fucosidase [Caldilineaceae bacterium]